MKPRSGGGLGGPLRLCMKADRRRVERWKSGWVLEGQRWVAMHLFMRERGMKSPFVLFAFGWLCVAVPLSRLRPQMSFTESCLPNSQPGKRSFTYVMLSCSAQYYSVMSSFLEIRLNFCRKQLHIQLYRDSL